MYAIVPNHVKLYAPNQEPALELHSRAAPNVEAYHRTVAPDSNKFMRKADQKIGT